MVPELEELEPELLGAVEEDRAADTLEAAELAADKAEDAMDEITEEAEDAAEEAGSDRAETEATIVVEGKIMVVTPVEAGDPADGS